MSKIEELIEKLCPDGVEFGTLKVICKSLNKGTLKTTDLKENAEYPVINAGRTIYGYYDNFNNDCEAFTFSSRGEYAGYVNYFNNKFWAGGLSYPYSSKDEQIIKTKFIYYYLKSKEKYIMKTLVEEGSIPALNKGDIEKFKIPIPPLEVQSEIVKVLDNFSELTAELTADLTARKQQYEYYREKMFTFENANMVSINDLIKDKYIKLISPSFKLKRTEYKSIGNTPIISQEIEYISGYTDLIDNKIQADKYVCFGDHSEHIKFIDFAFVQGADGLKIIKTNEDYISTKYLYYAISCYYVRKNSYERHFKYVADLEIPIPSIEKQREIVKILDKFSKLCEDISEGLPAEIEARQKQYEYYRDKLLTFKELKS